MAEAKFYCFLIKKRSVLLLCFLPSEETVASNAAALFPRRRKQATALEAGEAANFL